MRHVSITCKNHPNLRWSCKSIAWSGGYNGSRTIFFNGIYTGKLFSDKSGSVCSMTNDDGTSVQECDCKSDQLILAPEDQEIKEAFDAIYGEEEVTA